MHCCILGILVILLFRMSLKCQDSGPTQDKDYLVENYLINREINSSRMLTDNEFNIDPFVENYTHYTFSNWSQRFDSMKDYSTRAYANMNFSAEWGYESLAGLGSLAGALVGGVYCLIKDFDTLTVLKTEAVFMAVGAMVLAAPKIIYDSIN